VLLSDLDQRTAVFEPGVWTRQ